MTRSFAIVALVVTQALTAAAGEPEQPLAFTDQFGRRHDVADHRGEAGVFVYGDRKAAEACRGLGADLHVELHPAAADLPPARAHTAAVRPLPAASAGRSPEVRVVPVACTGSLPSLLRPVLIGQFRKAVPDVPM